MSGSSLASIICRSRPPVRARARPSTSNTIGERRRARSRPRTKIGPGPGPWESTACGQSGSCLLAPLLSPDPRSRVPRTVQPRLRNSWKTQRPRNCSLPSACVSKACSPRWLRWAGTIERPRIRTATCSTPPNLSPGKGRTTRSRADLQDRLAAVGRAEQRLADGTYGLSVRSGQPIPDERLEADPAAELTVDEARQSA